MNGLERMSTMTMAKAGKAYRRSACVGDCSATGALCYGRGRLQAHRRGDGDSLRLLASVVLYLLAGIAFEADARPHPPPQKEFKTDGAPPGYTTIDGKKNPEKIPDYAVWNSVFTTLQTLEPRWLRTQFVLP